VALTRRILLCAGLLALAVLAAAPAEAQKKRPNDPTE